MTHARYGRLGTKPGKRDALVEILTRADPEMTELGCLVYDVGVTDDDPDAVHVIEVWESAAAHRASLELEAVRAAIAEAMLLLAGAPSGQGFTVVGSPL